MNSRARRLLVVAPTAYTLGGLATWLNYLLPGLESRNWDVALGLVEGPRHHRPEPYLDLHPFGRVTRIPCSTGTTRGRVAAVRGAIRRHQPRSVVTINIPDAIVAVGMERRNRDANVRAIMTCHGIQRDLFDDMRLLATELDAVVCTNRLVCQLARHHGGIDRQRIFHASYGTALREESGPCGPQKVFTIAYVGRLEQPQKRTHDLVDLASELKNENVTFRLLIAGDGPEAAALKATVRERSLEEHVCFLGPVDAADLPEQVYRQADALLVTSRWETGPIVIWEAMAQGVPVVTSRYVGSGREMALFHESNCLMFDIGDVAAAAEQIRRLSKDPGLRQRLTDAAEQTVRLQYSTEVSVDRWDAVLQEIAARPSRPAARSALTPAKQCGRLDRWVGPTAADWLRRTARRLPPDTGPAGEWPHTLSGTHDDDEFRKLAARLDERVVTGQIPFPEPVITC